MCVNCLDQPEVSAHSVGTIDVAVGQADTYKTKADANEGNAASVMRRCLHSPCIAWHD